MTVYHNIEEKAEDSLAVWIAAQQTGLGGLNIYKGLGTSDLVEPFYSIVATESEPEIVGGVVLGNWFVTLRISIATNAHDTDRNTHNAYVGELLDLIIHDDLSTHLTGTDFTIFDWEPGPITRDADDDIYTTEIGGVLYCAPSDL